MVLIYLYQVRGPGLNLQQQTEAVDFKLLVCLLEKKKDVLGTLQIQVCCEFEAIEGLCVAATLMDLLALAAASQGLLWFFCLKPSWVLSSAHLSSILSVLFFFFFYLVM